MGVKKIQERKKWPLRLRPARKPVDQLVTDHPRSPAIRGKLLKLCLQIRVCTAEFVPTSTKPAACWIARHRSTDEC